MKVPPFTLVRRSTGRRSGTLEKDLLGTIEARNPDLAKALAGLQPRFRTSLLASAGKTMAADHPVPEVALQDLERAVHEVRRQQGVIRVGLWDIASQVGYLSEIIEPMNRVQPTFAFFELQAAVPSGLISRPERVVEWAEDLTGRTITAARRKEFRNNVIFEDFSVRAQRIRKDFGIDYVLGIVPTMVASEDDENIYWNSFAAEGGRALLVSTYDLHKYAKRAGRPFEMAVATVAIAILLAALNKRIEFHEETRGCLFDFNEDRASIVRCLKKPVIDQVCKPKLDRKHATAADALVTLLSEYKRPGS